MNMWNAYCKQNEYLEMLFLKVKTTFSKRSLGAIVPKYVLIDSILVKVIINIYATTLSYGYEIFKCQCYHARITIISFDLSDNVISMVCKRNGTICDTYVSRIQ